jgi:hypothetical protein
VIFIADTSKTDGSGLANLVYNSSGLVAYYFAGDLNNEVQITLVTATLGTYASGGFIAVDNTNMPGWYEIGIPDAALDGGNEVAIQLRGATNMAPVNIYIELDAVDYQTDAFGALRPTTAGRTLDVTATGAAGIDLGNVENPTTTLNLSGTTISTTQQVASVTGAVGSVTGAVGSVTGAVGSVTARVTANTDQWGGVTVTGMPLPTASYTTPPTAGTIADAVWDEAYNQHTTAGTFGKLMDILRKSNTVIEGTILATPTPTRTVFRISGADYPTGALEHAVLWMNSGASTEQNSPILTTTNNGDGTVTITLEEALVTAPSAGNTVLIDPTSHVHAIADIQSGLATSAAVAAVQADVTTLLGRITATLFSGITYLSRWLGALAGKTADASTQTEIRATTAGATYTITTDSLEAIRDNSGGGGGSGDASQTTLLEVQDTVESIAASLSGTTVTVSSRVSAAGEITLWAGDDCRVRSGTQIDVTITDVGGSIYTRLDGIGIANLAWGAARIVQPAGAITGTVAALTQAGSGASQTLKISIEITDGGSDLRAADDYTWQIVSSEQHGTEYDQQVELEGSLVLRRRVAVPVY